MPRTTPEPQSEVGKNLRGLIGEDSVNAWANRHKLSQTTINRIVTGRMDPTVSTLEKIAEAIGEEPWRLLAPSMGRAPVSFDRLAPDQAMLVTLFEFLTPEDQRELLISVKARARKSHEHPQTGGPPTTGADVPLAREQTNKSHESERTSWQRNRIGPQTRDESRLTGAAPPKQVVTEGEEPARARKPKQRGR
ncbi:helix-turn-helix domain-containing protein [Caldimonas mangrovi]|uniref:helix-turn-helix domain-containing protein n=1 Tax=Caldimonas mangrovi TaxID=2944811 RepID=UPI0034A2BAB0